MCKLVPQTLCREQRLPEETDGYQSENSEVTEEEKVTCDKDKKPPL